MDVYINIPYTGSASWKAPVPTYTALPYVGNNPGDVRVTLDTDDLYVWTGSAWQSVEGSSGVTSLNGIMGAVSIVAGSGITVTPSGQNIAIAATSSGSVTSVSVATANGLAGSSSGGSTPILTLSTTVTGILKGDGTAISAATAGTDYVIPSGSITGTAGNITATSNTTLTTLSSLSLPYSQITGAPGGTVTSVALSTPGVLYTVSGSPITTAGTLTLTLNTQAANTIFAGPISGSAATPTFRAVANADLSSITTLSSLSLPASQVTGLPAAGLTEPQVMARIFALC